MAINQTIERRYVWNNENIISIEIRDKLGGSQWVLAGVAPDCEFPGEYLLSDNAELEITMNPGNAFTPAHLQVDVDCAFGELCVRRRFRIYPKIPAIACDYFLSGTAQGSWRSTGMAAAEMSQLENAVAAVENEAPQVIIERIRATDPHLQYRAVQFFDVTDRRNNLVVPRDGITYRQPQEIPGQLLFIRDVLSRKQLFILKEAPCTDIQLAGVGYDFICRRDEFLAVGLGLTAFLFPISKPTSIYAPCSTM